MPAGGKVTVEQQRFFLSPSIQPDPRQKWTVPVCSQRAGIPDAQSCEVLTPATTSLKTPSGGIFFANARASGYYRSTRIRRAFLRSSSWRALSTELTPAERISLTGDEWSQLRANKATAGDYLNLVMALKADPNATVVSSALGEVDTIYDSIASTADEKAALAGWIRSTFSPIYAKLGPASETDSANLVELRASLFEFLGNYGKDPQIISEASRIAAKYIADPSSVDPNLGQTALIIAARNGDAELFDKLQERV